jgi:GDP/UDP-N,N'-diacetylbacillosamine 2-epimerase (hydrolysing)
MADSVINCKPTTKDIADALRYALSEEGKNKAASVHNPYGAGDTAKLVCETIHQYVLADSHTLKKIFHDL